VLHFRLGQVYQSMGSKDKAVAQYTTFLDLWKDAEGIPPEKVEAYARLEHLQGER
jgi:hypothetical protein